MKSAMIVRFMFKAWCTWNSAISCTIYNFVLQFINSAIYCTIYDLASLYYTFCNFVAEFSKYCRIACLKGRFCNIRLIESLARVAEFMVPPMDLFSWPRNPGLKSRDRIKMCRAVPPRIHGWLNLDGWIFVFLDRLMSDAAWHLYHPALASLSIKQTWFSIMIINSTKTTRVFLTKLFK